MDRIAADLRIRELEVSDAAALEAFYAALDPETRCLRFCAASRGLTHDQSAWFCRHDGTRHEGLVATLGRGPNEQIVGHLCLEPENADAAEVAVVVADRLQHRGIGRQLVDAGIAWARANGIRTLTATMLVGNEPIFRLLTGLGLPHRASMSGDGTCRVDIDVRPPVRSERGPGLPTFRRTPKLGHVAAVR
jgi:GNAT superfamily N-acetyltransferase